MSLAPLTGLSALTDWALGVLPLWGPWALALITFLSCLALPVPASLIMIAGGAFVATGDLALGPVAGAAFAGALAGDQLGFALGRRLGRLLPGAQTRRGRLIAQALAALEARGAAAVFLSRWMFSALGPWVNFAAGASGFGHRRFSFAGALGEAVWVGLYIGLGLAFGSNLQAAADLASNTLGLMAAGTVTLATGWWLLSALRSRSARAACAPEPDTDGETVPLPDPR